MRRRRRAYPTDAQWAAIVDLVPEALPGGRPRRASSRGLTTRSSMRCAAARLGACCRTTSRLGRRSTTTSGAGRPKAYGAASAMPCWSLTASGRDAKPARRPPSSTASRCGPAIKRGLPRLRRGQEGRRAQTAHPDRRRRPPARGSGPCRQRPGSRRRKVAAARLASPLVLRPVRVRRWRIRRQARRLGEAEGQPRAVHCQAATRPTTLRAAATPMGHRTHLRLAHQEPPPCP